MKEVGKVLMVVMGVIAWVWLVQGKKQKELRELIVRSKKYGTILHREGEGMKIIILFRGADLPELFLNIFK